jgi:hypothetical protein
MIRWGLSPRDVNSKRSSDHLPGTDPTDPQPRAQVPRLPRIRSASFSAALAAAFSVLMRSCYWNTASAAARVSGVSSEMRPSAPLR